MKALCDSHVHSHFSVDSSAPIDQMCHGAITAGISCLAFTEHYDLNPRDIGYKFFKPDQFSQAFSEARSRFSPQLDVLKGVEFGEPHCYPEVFSALQVQDYDVIIGSIHWVGKFFAGAKEALLAYTPKMFYERYYQEVLATVRFGGCDILAHFDFPKRYLKINITDLPVINEVLKRMIDTGIVLEVNTSPLRKGLTSPSPGREVLEMYASLGGQRISLGSDAHTPEEIGSDFEYVLRMLKEFPGMEVGYVKQRQFIPYFTAETRRRREEARG